ncbi:MAG: glycosyltransferase family 2 protein [Pseudomonadota bacterium]
MTDRRPSLAAVIVTYNRREKLEKVIAALEAQTRAIDEIIVVDNASDDGTGDLLAARVGPGFRHLRLPENIGGAGGFNAGTRAAYEAGHDLIWLSDDDAYPEPDAIGTLESALADFEARHGRRPSFACSMVRWTDGSLCEMNTPPTVWDWPRFYTPQTPWFLVRSCSFVSALVPRRSIEKHGLPIKDYFIWYDDAEYTKRLARGQPGLYVPNSVIVHDLPKNKGVNYGLVDEANIWKFEYGARNETSARWRDDGWFGVLEFLRHVWIQTSRAKVSWRLRRRVALAIWRGLFFRPKVERAKG